jgi:hypothetical protein
MKVVNPGNADPRCLYADCRTGSGQAYKSETNCEKTKESEKFPIKKPVLRIWIRDPVFFYPWIWDPRSEMEKI